MNKEESVLVPDLIKDLVAKMKTARGNEKFMYEARLNAIVTYIEENLK